jgi:hypothetical protein
MSAWETVFDAQMEIWRFWKSPLGEQYANGFIDDCNRKGKGYETLAGQWAEIESSRMYRAEPIYVAPEMMDLLDVAIPGFEPEPLLPSDLLTDHGFVVFPRPFHVTDVNGLNVSWRAMCWAVTDFQYSAGVSKGIMISLYSHMDDPDDIGYPPEAYDSGTKFSLMHIAPWAFGLEIPDIKSGKEGLGQIQCFFRLTMQHITTHEPQAPSRGVRRRARRQKMPEKNVTVIRLRRPKAQREGEPVPANYSHRFLVRGHWRNQWFPSLKTHRQIYIHEFIKGPEDKPLRISERRAFELVQ